MKKKFWQYGLVHTSNDKIVLRDIQADDRKDYLEIQREYSAFKDMLNDKKCCDIAWNEHIQEQSLMCAITQDGTYIGYCGIKDTTVPSWEIVIELKPEWTKKGIGAVALTAFLYQVKERLNVKEYTLKIDPFNTPSQKMFEKIGAVPNGIAELWIHDQEMLNKIEKDNLDKINEDIIAVAEKFSVEPRKLLSHVLQYELTLN